VGCSLVVGQREIRLKQAQSANLGEKKIVLGGNYGQKEAEKLPAKTKEKTIQGKG